MAALVLLAARSTRDVGAAVALVRRADAVSLFLALGFQCLYYLCAGLVVRCILRLVDFHAPFWWTVRAAFLLILVSRIVPGPAATGPAVMYYLLERRGLSRTRSAFVGPLFYAVDYGVFFLLLAGSLVVVSFRHRLTAGDLAAVPFLGIAAAIVAGLVWMVSRPERVEGALRPVVGLANAAARLLHIGRQVPGTAPARVAHHTREIVTRLKAHPALAWKAVGAGLAMLLCDVATMAFTLRAFGAVLPVSSAVLGFSLATMGALVSFLPGGLGTFDAAMVIGFAGLGAPRPAAIAATLVYRLIATWFPALPGLHAYHRFAREGRVGVRA